MTFSTLSFCYFILHFFFLARYRSTVRLTQNVNTDWHHGLVVGVGTRSALSASCLLFLYCYIRKPLQKAICISLVHGALSSFSYLPFLVSYICVHLQLLCILILDKIWFVWPNWELRSNSWLSEESIYKLSLTYYVTCPVSRFPHTPGDLFLIPTVVLDSRTS